MTGGGRHEITFSRCARTATESLLGEGTLCPKQNTQRQPIIDVNKSFDRIIMEDTSEWLDEIVSNLENCAPAGRGMNTCVSQGTCHKAKVAHLFFACARPDEEPQQKTVRMQCV